MDMAKEASSIGIKTIQVKLARFIQMKSATSFIKYSTSFHLLLYFYTTTQDRHITYIISNSLPSFHKRSNRMPDG
jgi:hypothetical protein